MKIFSKRHLLFSCLILLDIVKAVMKCSFSIVINACNEIEFALKSDENTHKMFLRNKRNCIQNHGLSNVRSKAVNQNHNPSTVDCIIYDLPTGKNVTVNPFNNHTVVTNFRDFNLNDPNNFQYQSVTVTKTSGPVYVKLNDNFQAKVQYLSDRLGYARMTSINRKTFGVEKVIIPPIESKQSKSKFIKPSSGSSCSKIETSDRIDSLSGPNKSESKLAKHSINVPEQNVKLSSQYPLKAVDFSHKYVYPENTTIPVRENQKFVHPIESTRSSRHKKQVLTQSKSKFIKPSSGGSCSKIKTTDRIDSVSGLNKNKSKLAENSVNFPEQKVELSSQFQLKAVDFSSKYVYPENTIIRENVRENQEFKDYESSSDLHKAKLECDANGSAHQLDAHCSGNTITDNVLSDLDEVSLHSKSFENPNQQQNHPALRKRRKKTKINKTLPINNETNDEVKTNSSKSDTSIASCSTERTYESSKVKTNMIVTNIAGSDSAAGSNSSNTIYDNPIDRTVIHSDQDNSGIGNIVSQDILNTTSKTCQQDYIDFLRQMQPVLINIEKEVLNVCYLNVFNLSSDSDDVNVLNSKVNAFINKSHEVNSKPYHHNVLVYFYGITKMVFMAKAFLRESQGSLDINGFSLYLEYLESWLSEHRKVLIQPGTNGIEQWEQITRNVDNLSEETLKKETAQMKKEFYSKKSGF